MTIGFIDRLRDQRSNCVDDTSRPTGELDATEGSVDAGVSSATKRNNCEAEAPPSADVDGGGVIHCVTEQLDASNGSVAEESALLGEEAQRPSAVADGSALGFSPLEVDGEGKPAADEETSTFVHGEASVVNPPILIR